jgi:putative phosphoribosyl transferase
MFQDRRDAGRLLAGRLSIYRDRPDLLILALPRGGVVVGYEIADELRALLDVLIVRKIGHPYEPELAIGAVAETGVVALNQDIIAMYGISERYIQDEIERQKGEIARRVSLYRGGTGISRLEGRTILLVDDGIATGATMRAAIMALKQEPVAKLVVALPVAPAETAAKIKTMVDDFICLEIPSEFMAVGAHYRDFAQTTDQEVIDLLHRSSEKAA